MASLTQVLASSNAAPIEDINIAGNLNEGLKAGINLATAKEQVDSAKMKVADQKLELVTKQATAMTNRTKAAMFAQSPAAFESIMKANEAYANSINVPYNSDALRAAWKDPNLRLAAQRETNRVMAGGQLTNPQAIIDFYGSDSPAIFDHLQNASYKAGVVKQGQDFELEKQRRAIEAQKDVAAISAANKEKSTGARLDFQAERIHNKNLDSIRNDKIVSARVTQVQNLQNALSNFKAGGQDPTSFHEMQQAVRSNLGIKGQSTGSERADSYLKDTGLSAAEFKQFLTGDIADISNYSPNFVKHIEALVNNEIQRATVQANKAIDKWAVGHGSFYEKHPELKKDFNDFLGVSRGQFEDVPTTYDKTETPPVKSLEQAMKDAEAIAISRKQKFDPIKMKPILEAKGYK